MVSLAIAAFLAPGPAEMQPPSSPLLPAAYANHPAKCLTPSGHVHPTISSIRFTSPNGTYYIDETVGIRVTGSGSFNSASRSFLETTGFPHTAILLSVGAGIERFATYANSYSFADGYVDYAYTVQAGDMSGDLDYVATDSLHWKWLGANIQDQNDDDYLCTLPAPGTTGSLANQSSIVVDGSRTRPAIVQNVTSAVQNGTYPLHTEIAVTVNFDRPVMYQGTGAEPYLIIGLDGGVNRTAPYMSGGGTAMVFNYTVQASDTSADLDYNGTNSLRGNITNRHGHTANLTLARPGDPGSLGHSKDIAVDGAAPAVASVSSPNATRTYGQDDAITVRVNFSEPVTVLTPEGSGAPYLSLDVGRTAHAAAYSGGNNTDSLSFKYAVRAGAKTASLNHAGTAISLNGSSIADAAGNAANVTLPDPAGSGSLAARHPGIGIVAPPAASRVGAQAATPDGAYGAGRTVGVQVVFTDSVMVDTTGGSPYLVLADAEGDGGTFNATYAGNTTYAMLFGYTVAPGDRAADLNHAGASALRLNGSAVNGTGAAASLSARLALPDPSGPGSLAASSSIALDGVAPRVVNVTSAVPDGAYRAGLQVNVTVEFDERVSYSGPAPVLLLNVSEEAKEAPYASGNGTAGLVFSYTVRAGDEAADLSYYNSTALSGAIADAAGNPANLTLPEHGSLSASAEIVLDGVAPRVVNVTSAVPDGAYRAGLQVNVTVEFDERVSYSGPAPVLLLNVSEEAKEAPYASGNGTAGLVFSYTVRAGDEAADLSYYNSTALSGAIADAAGNPANLTLPEHGSLSGSAEIVLDGVAPRVVNVTSAVPDGAYRAGLQVNVTVEFDERVSYSGPAPVLLLNVSGAPRAAPYDSGNGTAGLVFSYTVRAGDEAADLSYYNSTALSGAIVDAAGNPANLTLPEPGSLSWSAAISARGAAGPAAATAAAAFTGPNTVRIDYSAPLRPGAGHEGPVYGAVSVPGRAPAAPEPGGVSGLGTHAHTVRFGGDGVSAGQSGSIVLLADLQDASPGAQYAFPAGAIPVAAGESARTLTPAGEAPVVAIEDGGFVREVNATGAGDAARPAINVTGLAAAGSFIVPPGGVAVATSFAKVALPANATASPVPAGGLIEIRLAETAPAAQQVADAVGGRNATALKVLPVVAVGGGNATGVTFDRPVRILLAGQAGGIAFRVADGGAVVPIDAVCAADDAGVVHAQLNGSGECHIDPAGSGDKAVYAYGLGQFGTARGVEDVCAAALGPPDVGFGKVRAGGPPGTANQTVSTLPGSLPLAAASVSATPWTGADGSTVMPAGATRIMAGGGGAGVWVPLGEAGVEVPADGGRAVAKLLLDVPPGTAASTASQIVTYTVTCGAPPG